MTSTTKSLRLLPACQASFNSFSSTTTAPKVRYEILRPHQLPIVHKLLYQSFHRDEPMTRHLGLNKGAFSIPDSDGMAENLVLNHNISIIALDANNNNAPLGIILNGEFHRKELDVTRQQVIEGCIDPGFAPIAAILHQCQQRGREAFEALGADVLFDLKMVATAPESRGLGLATDLLQRSVMLAKCLGYKGVKSEATGTYSRKAIAKCGLEVVDVVRYDEFTMEGNKVLSGIQGHQGVTYMMAKL